MIYKLVLIYIGLLNLIRGGAVQRQGKSLAGAKVPWVQGATPLGDAYYEKLHRL